MMRIELGVADQWTDGETLAYRDSRMHLKTTPIVTFLYYGTTKISSLQLKTFSSYPMAKIAPGRMTDKNHHVE